MNGAEIAWALSESERQRFRKRMRHWAIVWRKAVARGNDKLAVIALSNAALFNRWARAELPEPPDIANTPPSGVKTARNVNPSAMGCSTHGLGRCDVCGHLTSQPTTIDGRAVCPICRSEMLIIKGRSQ